MLVVCNSHDMLEFHFPLNHVPHQRTYCPMLDGVERECVAELGPKKLCYLHCCHWSHLLPWAKVTNIIVNLLYILSLDHYEAVWAVRLIICPFGFAPPVNDYSGRS